MPISARLMRSAATATATATASTSTSITIQRAANWMANYTTAAKPSCGSVPKEKADCVVIGAGVVGLAIARELALRGREVLVVDSASTFGTVTSSRNSEVVHAGIYYPPNSLKARFCTKGRDLIYKYCSERGVPHKQIGKLIVATRDSEVSKLDQLMALGTRNGVEGLKMLGSSEAASMEPELRCAKALLSPVSGIIDSHSFMLSLLGEAESKGAVFSYNTAVLGGHFEGNQIHLHVTGSHNLESLSNKEEDNHDDVVRPELILCPKILVNSAGLGAIAFAKRLIGLPREAVPPAAFFARGCYFSLTKTKPPFNHLIYPVPEDGGLGVHVTLDLNGQVKFGPDVEWIDDGVDDNNLSIFLNKFDYSVSPSRAERFYPEIRKYYPNLKGGSLEPGYSGIRPKLSSSGQPPADFVIQGEDVHGIPGLVNLFGIESPGLTSSMAIAEHVVSSRLLLTRQQ